MQRATAFALLVVLGWTCTALLESIARHYDTAGRLSLEFGPLPRRTLTERTRARLAALETPVDVTYYVSERAAMPSNMRDVERTVTDLLEAMRRAAPERFDYTLVDPATHPELKGFASRRRISPFRARSVKRDEIDEETVWSTLAIGQGAGRETTLHAIGPDDLPWLQLMIVEALDELRTASRPRFALASDDPVATYDKLADALSARGELERVDLTDDILPSDVDVLWWMNPRGVTPARLARIEAFLERGGSLVVAGSTQVARSSSLLERDGRPHWISYPSSAELSPLLAPFGLRADPGLVLDQRSENVVFEGEELFAPFFIRCIAPNQSFESWSTQPNGTLLFLLPAALALDAGRLARAGLDATALATSSDETWMQPLPALSEPAPIAFDALREELGTPVAKVPLVVEVRGADPWRGRLIACAATTPFEDGFLHRPGTAHARLVETLADELAAPEHRIRRRARERGTVRLPWLAGRTRLVWRGLVVLLVPLLFGLFGARRALATLLTQSSNVSRSRLAPLALALAAVPLTGALVQLFTASPLSIDLTSDRRNTPADATVRLARAAGDVTAELLLSDRDRLPPSMRSTERAVRALCARLIASGAKLELSWVAADDADAATLAGFADDGVLPAALVADRESSGGGEVFAALRLTAQERSTIVDLTDAAALEELEFRLAFALRRLTTGITPTIAFASDVPRPSAAEAYENFQEKGLFAPKGVDVYGAARRRLASAGFRVVHVNPRAPAFDEEVDVLVWMQPRRSIEPMLERTVRYLHGGGPVLLAAQHFVVQSRQYRGTQFDLVYWPQPQTPDVELLYFPELGIRMVREVLFDDSRTSIEMASRITGRTGGRDFESQVSALPFLIRARAANFAADDLVTRGLGDQAFLFGSFLAWDEGRLKELGLRATPLITTSARSWSFDWKGRWLPPEVLEGPLPDVDGQPGSYAGKLPLVVRFEGTFPRPENPLSFFPPEEADTTRAEAPWPEPEPGTLLWCAGSELFKDAWLMQPEARADHLLVNAVASLALEPELAAVAGRRAMAPGFDWVAPETRLGWRGLVLGLPPLALALLGGASWIARRRPRP